MATKNAPTILFLHGALGVTEDLLPLREIMEQKGCKTLGFNFSGHGQKAASPSEFRIDLFARDLEKYIQDHSLKNVVVFGYSMGGYVALYHKANFEDSPITHIFTYGTKFNWSAGAVAKELQMLSPEHILEKFPHYAESLQAKHGDQWKHLLRSTAHMMQNLERIDGLTREDVHGIEIPVTFMLGEQDRMVTHEETKTFASWLHHQSIKTIPHSKHEIDKANLSEIALIMSRELL